jgi:beta-lactamase class C
VKELQGGGDIAKVTLGELATHTSGLPRVPQEPGHRGTYKLPGFLNYLSGWKADKGHEPGKQDVYSNAGFVLLQLALQRHFDKPAAQLMNDRLLTPLGMSSTSLPVPTANTRGQLAPAFKSRAVQGYGPAGRPIGAPGDLQGLFDWPGTGQLYSSARDMAVFLAANLGVLKEQRPLQEAMAFAQQGVFTVNPRFTQALAWQRVQNGNLTIVDKNGGLDNTSAYIGMIRQARLGIVILMNRGKQPATKLGRQIMLDLAGHKGVASEDGNDGNDL